MEPGDFGIKIFYLLCQTRRIAGRHSRDSLLLFRWQVSPVLQFSTDSKDEIFFFNHECCIRKIRKYISSTTSTLENSVKGLIVNYQHGKKCPKSGLLSQIRTISNRNSAPLLISLFRSIFLTDSKEKIVY